MHDRGENVITTFLKKCGDIDTIEKKNKILFLFYCYILFAVT